jgi:Domain of unknown function (DUF4410)
MQEFCRLTRPKLCRTLRGTPLLLTALVCMISPHLQAEGPLAAKVTITPLQSYSGSPALPKPDKILVYDFVVNSSDVQVDKSQSIRPRHLIRGDKKPDAIAAEAMGNFSEELVKKLEKTGLPVQHVDADTAPSNNALVVQGSFLALKEGDKAERVSVGMGAGAADVQSKVDVRLKTPTDAIIVSEFQTQTSPAGGMGAGVPVAAGLDPAAAVAKSKVTDRKKTLNAYASKTADATATEITKLMGQQGWVKLDAKGEVIP